MSRLFSIRQLPQSGEISEPTAVESSEDNCQAPALPVSEIPNFLADHELSLSDSVMIDQNINPIENKELLLAFAYRHKISDSAMTDRVLNFLFGLFLLLLL